MKDQREVVLEAMRAAQAAERAKRLAGVRHRRWEAEGQPKNTRQGAKKKEGEAAAAAAAQAQAAAVAKAEKQWQGQIKQSRDQLAAATVAANFKNDGHVVAACQRNRRTLGSQIMEAVKIA